jgi:hypothetical protein
MVCQAGSINAAMATGLITDGIMHALWEKQIPFVLAGSIPDDGPLPGVITDIMSAQDAMRGLASRATTVLAVASQLHSIATGNLIPLYQIAADGHVRLVFLLRGHEQICHGQAGQPGFFGGPGHFGQCPGFSGDFGAGAEL